MTQKKSVPTTHADVLHFSSRKNAREGVGEIIKTCQRIGVEKLDGLLTVMFERADDTLFDLGERAGSNLFQTRYFDSMRELRRQRKNAVGAFQGDIIRGFKRFAERAPSEAANNNTLDIKEKDLSLVDEEQYEETLAINNMVNKAENLYLHALHALNKRFSVLQGGLPLEPGANPAGPARICEAFRVATEPFDLDIQARIVVYKLFDRFVMEHLEDLYGALNKALVDAGVLPEIKSTIRRAPDRYRSRHQGADHDQHEAPGEPPPAGDGQARYADSNVSEQDRILNVIEDLLAIRHGPASPRDGSTRAPASAGYASPEAPLQGGSPSQDGSLHLLNALATLQTEVADVPEQGRPIGQGQLKKLLTGKVRLMTGSTTGQVVSSQEEDTIDLVGMLFEFIVQDRNLPDPIQASLTRLQIPYLKIALTNKRFFVQRNHPARKLLDAMARAGIGWTPQNDKGDLLLGKLRAIVERVLTEFDDDIALFEELYDDFEAFVDKHQQVARIAEKRTTEATQGRERLHQARTRAAKEITQRLQQSNLPAVVQKLLAQPWSNVLILILLRQGADSEEWSNALKVADDLVWAVAPKRDEAQRARLRELILPLTEAIEQGLSLVAIHADEVERIRNGLMDAFEVAMNGQPVDADAVDTAYSFELPKWIMELGGNQDSDGARTKKADKEKAVARLKIEVGTWLEFTGEDSAVQRAKLSWISPISRRYLFVNHKGLKVADMSPEALITGLRDGRITVLDDVPLVDRALVSIEKRLREK